MRRLTFQVLKKPHSSLIIWLDMHLSPFQFTQRLCVLDNDLHSKKSGAVYDPYITITARPYKDQFQVIRYWFNRRLDFDYQTFKSKCKYPSATKKQIIRHVNETIKVLFSKYSNAKSYHMASCDILYNGGLRPSLIFFRSSTIPPTLAWYITKQRTPKWLSALC